MAAGNMEHIVDVDAGLVGSMVRRVCSMKGAGAWHQGMRTIHRIPSNIRKGDEDAYSPKIVSIGPYHQREQGLQAMEVHKWEYLHELLGFDLETNIAKCVRELKSVEARARNCYADINLSSTEFVEMMLLDGCFIIEFLAQRHENDLDPVQKDRKKKAGDPIHGVSWTSPLLRHDLLLLENQIPFFVLQVLFDVAVKPPSDTPPLAELALHYLTHGSKDVPHIMYSTQPHHLLHLLHLFHSCLLPDPEPLQPRSQWQLLRLLFRARTNLPLKLTKSVHITEERIPRTIPCAAELQEAGIRFRKKEAASFLDVTFSNSVLELPLLSVGNSTNPIFRNLIAFEQCCPTAGSYFTSYAVLMDDLINTSRDVAILHRRGIIENKLGSDEEVALLFNRLLMQVSHSAENNYFAELFKKVNAHCGSKWNKWRSKLVREYFSNPWSIISLLAAIVLLMLTIVQTMFAITSFYHTSNRS